MDLTGARKSHDALPSGTALQGGRYLIQSILGKGGFAITYLARDTLLDRLVAIKELFPEGCVRALVSWEVQPQDLPEDIFQQLRLRFLDEARLLARLNHSGVVRVYDVFEANNTGYIVMEYLDGQTLAQILQARGGKMPEGEAIGYILKVCDALHCVHQENFLHRDIKPSNIVVTKDGRVVLIDFGNARMFAAGKTLGYTVAFTPAYAPLEQYASSGRLDARTDLYSLGATLYHLVTGVPPLPAPERSQGAILLPPHQLEHGVNPDISREIMRALELSIERRPTSVAEWADALIQFSKQSSDSPLLLRLSSRTRNFSRLLKNTRRLGMIFASLLGLALLLRIWVVHLQKPPTEIRLHPPLSGATVDINKSIQRVESGGIIYLGSGTYTLERPLKVDKPLRLICQDPDGIAKVVSNHPNHVIVCDADGKVVIENIQFLYEGSLAANVCEVLRGEVQIDKCSFQGAVWDASQNYGGSGVIICGDAKVDVRRSSFKGNRLHGIEVLERASLTAINNVFEENNQSGVALFEHATALLQDNICKGNGNTGISVYGNARLTAVGNICEGNGEGGLVLFDNASGELRENTLRRNGLNGIEAQGNSRLIALWNTCEFNSSGIIFLDRSTGEARGNLCRYNDWGIVVQKSATPKVAGNRCYVNIRKDYDDQRRRVRN